VINIISGVINRIGTGELQPKRESTTAGQDLNKKPLSDNKQQAEVGTLAPIPSLAPRRSWPPPNKLRHPTQTGQETILKCPEPNGVASPSLEAHHRPTKSGFRRPCRVADQDMVAEALSARPDAAQLRIQLTNDGINLRSQSELPPSLVATANLG
jgi:hypothetical protein